MGRPELTTTIAELEDWYALPQDVRGVILFACVTTQLWILIALTGYKSKPAKAKMRAAINDGAFLDYVTDPARRPELRS